MTAHSRKSRRSLSIRRPGARWPGSNDDENVMEAPGDVLHVQALSAITRALTCLSWPEARVHTGVHEARKAMRRMRACLRLAFGAAPGDWRAIDRAIAGIARSLSDLRDAQARVERMRALLAASSDPSQRRLLRRALQRLLVQRQQALMQARSGGDGLSQRQRELRLLVHTIDALPWSQVRVEEVQRALQVSNRRRTKARRTALRDGGQRAWHRWRRCERLIVLQHKVLADCSIAVTGQPVIHPKLAKRLGLAQDCSVLVDHFQHDDALPSAERDALLNLLRRARRDVRRRIRHRARVHAQRDRVAARMECRS